MSLLALCLLYVLLFSWLSAMLVYQHNSCELTHDYECCCFTTFVIRERMNGRVVCMPWAGC